jgi:toxin ParE1/3/4
VSGSVVIRPQAESDLIEHAVFLGQDSPVVAQRFLDAVDRVLADLVRMPALGRQREFGDSRLTGLRSYLITAFESYIVFYLPTDSGIDVVRVLHGAQDIEEHLRE